MTICLIQKNVNDIEWISNRQESTPCTPAVAVVNDWVQARGDGKADHKATIRRRGDAGIVERTGIDEIRRTDILRSRVRTRSLAAGGMGSAESLSSLLFYEPPVHARFRRGKPPISLSAWRGSSAVPSA